jgi:hypothetical protein
MKFTLTEIMILLAVIAMLIAIAIPPVRRRLVHRPIAASIILVMMALLAMLVLPAQAQPQIQPYQPITLIPFTNLPTVLTAGSFSNTTSYVDVPQKFGLSFSLKFNASAGTSNVCVIITPTNDGTNYDTTGWALNRNANGATDVVLTTNWTHGQLNAFRRLKIMQMTNQNNGTVTNKGGQWGLENP